MPHVVQSVVFFGVSTFQNLFKGANVCDVRDQKIMSMSSLKPLIDLV